VVYLTAIFIYLILLVCIGIYKSRQVKTEEDFAVAGRTLSPWVMVCTMLAVWIGTGSIVGNAEQTYETGMAALLIPLGTLFGMILLSLIATHARNIEASSVPEIIGRRYGNTARLLAVVALVTAYMVIVSYQFNAGGAVLEVISGDKDPVPVQADSTYTQKQLTAGRIVYTPPVDWTGTVELEAVPVQGPARSFTYRIEVVEEENLLEAARSVEGVDNTSVMKANTAGKIRYTFPDKMSGYMLKKLPEQGAVDLIEPKLSAKRATIIAAAFIIAYTMLAGLLSLAYMDIVTGILITVSVVVAFPILLIKAGGFSGMSEAFTLMGDKANHMQLWGVYSPVQLVNFLLPVFLLILGDANQYQRIFASRNARGARQAVTVMIFLALAIEMLIIADAWVASSMTPDVDNGKYILIYAAKHHMPLILGMIFLVTVVGIIISTANSFLLIPSVTFIKDIYQTHINPKAGEKHVIFLNRILILVFGVIGYGVSLMFSESTGFFRKALYAYTIYGSAITPCLVAAIIWKRSTRAGAIASILSGTVITLLWGELIQPNLSGWLGELDAVLPAIAVSVTALIVISLMTPPNTEANHV
jgi:Na+/proline symporter